MTTNESASTVSLAEGRESRLYRAAVRVLDEANRSNIEPHTEDADGALAELGAACAALVGVPEGRETTEGRED